MFLLEGLEVCIILSSLTGSLDFDEKVPGPDDK